MSTIIDYNQIAASAYNTIQSLNSMATSIVGIDCSWCRLLPYDNGEDVIVQEYTLHQYECPKPIKLILTNSAYQVGNFQIDLFGIHSEAPVEINIGINVWKDAYGENTRPQKGDFVLIPFLHKAFEVKSSTIIHTIGEYPTAFKCQLADWKHTASRKETEEFKISIDELTDSQDRLFGDIISNEVADAVVEIETSYNNTTYNDPIKTFDIDSITVVDDADINNIPFTNAYYDFSSATCNVLYSLEAEYCRSAKENHWIYSTWFNFTDNLNESEGKLKIASLYLKEKDYWYFTIQSGIAISHGDEVLIHRGNAIQLSGVIEQQECSTGYVIKILASDCFAANKKIKDWWKAGIWKIKKYNDCNLLSCYNDQELMLQYNIDFASFNIKHQGNSINIPFGNISLKTNIWYYITIDMTYDNIHVIICNRQTKLDDNAEPTNKLIDINKSVMISDFDVTSVSIENKSKNVLMTNIRLYEDSNKLTNEYKQDMFSKVTRNASKLLLVDSPNAANKMSFITPIK